MWRVWLVVGVVLCVVAAVVGLGIAVMLQANR